MNHIYIHILQTYVRVRIIYWHEVYDTYFAVYVRMCTYMTSNEQYIALSPAVYACISSTYLLIPTVVRQGPTLWWGGSMLVYACICMYFGVKYMNRHRVRTWTYFQQYIWQHFGMYFQQYWKCALSLPLRPVRAVSAPSPRGRYGKFVARQRTLKQIATFNQIRSVRLTSGNMYRCCALAARWSAVPAVAILVGADLAVVHEVTAEPPELQRPINVEMMISLSNRQPLLRKRSWGFLNQVHTKIQAQKINANVYKVTEIIWECHGIAAIAYYKESNDWCHMPKYRSEM